MSDQSERRTAVRVPVVLPVEVSDERSFFVHSSRDLSTGGVFFDRAIPWAVGSRVQLAFSLPGEGYAIRCDGEVVNVPDTRGYGMGIRFIGLSADDANHLEAFVRESAGGA